MISNDRVEPFRQNTIFFRFEMTAQLAEEEDKGRVKSHVREKRALDLRIIFFKIGML